MNYPETNTESAWDMSFSTFGRINFWLWKANEAQVSQDVSSWYESCQVLYKELHPYLNERKKDNPKEKHDLMRKKTLSEYRNYLLYVKNYNSSPRKGEFQPPKEIYDTLYEWELQLRKDLQDVGILLKKSESAYGAILG